MAEEKKRDLLLNMVANPSFSMADFEAVGINSNNITIKDKDAYMKNNYVQDSKLFKDSEGNFSQEKFDSFYTGALKAYNVFIQDKDQKILDSTLLYGFADRYAPKEQRVDPVNDVHRFEKGMNPDRITKSIFEFGKDGPRTLSTDEIMQTLQIFDSATGKFKDYSPNERGFWNFEHLFGDTLVQAQWDFDADINGNPTDDPEKVVYAKGTPKLNENGTYYYETLNGRDVYGRRVLNRMNVLTTDGSFANKFDFFDTDDINEKSVVGTLMRNTALVGSMFIPYVGWAVAAASALTQLAGIAAVAGKVIKGNDSPTLSAIEGFAQSWNRQYGKTEYAQQHTWCSENFISIIFDLMAQLRELKFLMEFVPMAVYGNKMKGLNWGWDEKKKAQWLNEIQSQKKKLLEREATELAKGNELALLRNLQQQEIAYKILAQKEVEAYEKSYMTLGSALAKTYMAGLISSNLYGELKHLGVSDGDASLFTTARFLAEVALLNTKMGDYILPQLRADKLRMQNMGEGFFTNPKVSGLEAIVNGFVQAYKTAATEGTTALNATGQALPGALRLAMSWVTHLPTNAAKIEMADNWGAIFKASFAGGVEAGVVNDIEELFNDLAKAGYNLKSQLQDRDHRVEAFGMGPGARGNNFDSVIDRYLMGMVSGVVGATITGSFDARTQINAAKKLSDFESSTQQLVALIRNNELEPFLKEFNKTLYASKDLSTEFELDSSGNKIWKKAKTYEESQDYAVHKLVWLEIAQIQSIMKDNGAMFSDDSIFGKYKSVLADVKMSILLNSKSFARSLQDFNSWASDLVSAGMTFNSANLQMTDLLAKVAKQKSQQEKEVAEVTGEAQDLGSSISKLQETLNSKLDAINATKKKIEDFISGKFVGDYVMQSLIEFDPVLSQGYLPISEATYAEMTSGKKYTALSDAEKEYYHDYYESYTKLQAVHYYEAMGKLINNATRTLTNTIKDSLDAHATARGSLLARKVSDFVNRFRDSAFKAKLLYTAKNEEGKEVILERDRLVAENMANEVLLGETRTFSEGNADAIVDPKENTFQYSMALNSFARLLLEIVSAEDGSLSSQKEALDKITELYDAIARTHADYVDIAQASKDTKIEDLLNALEKFENVASGEDTATKDKLAEFRTRHEQILNEDAVHTTQHTELVALLALLQNTPRTTFSPEEELKFLNLVQELATKADQELHFTNNSLASLKSEIVKLILTNRALLFKDVQKTAMEMQDVTIQGLSATIDSFIAQITAQGFCDGATKAVLGSFLSLAQDLIQKSLNETLKQYEEVKYQHKFTVEETNKIVNQHNAEVLLKYNNTILEELNTLELSLLDLVREAVRNSKITKEELLDLLGRSKYVQELGPDSEFATKQNSLEDILQWLNVPDNAAIIYTQLEPTAAIVGLSESLLKVIATMATYRQFVYAKTSLNETLAHLKLAIESHDATNSGDGLLAAITEIFLYTLSADAVLFHNFSYSGEDQSGEPYDETYTSLYKSVVIPQASLKLLTNLTALRNEIWFNTSVDKDSAILRHEKGLNRASFPGAVDADVLPGFGGSIYEILRLSPDAYEFEDAEYGTKYASQLQMPGPSLRLYFLPKSASWKDGSGWEIAAGDSESARPTYDVIKLADLVKMDGTEFQFTDDEVALQQTVNAKLDQLRTKLDQVGLVKAKIKATPDTPITKIIDSIIKDADGIENMTLNELVLQLENLITQNAPIISLETGNSLEAANGKRSIANFKIDVNLLKLLTGTIRAVDFLKRIILCAKEDGLGANYMLSVNKVINDVSHKVGVENYEDLITISSADADVLLNDLNRISVTLNYYLELYDAVSQKKLLEIKLAGVNTHFVVYNKIENLVKVISEDLEKDPDADHVKVYAKLQETIKAALSEATTLQSKYKSDVGERDLNLDEATYAAVTKESLAIKLALGKFLTDESGQLDETVAKVLFSPRFFGELGMRDTLTTGGITSNSFSDNNLISLMLDCAALNYRDFLAAYRKQFADNSKIMPLPGLEEAVAHFIAMFANKGLFAKAKDIILSNFHNYLDSRTAEQLKEDLIQKHKVPPAVVESLSKEQLVLRTLEIARLPLFGATALVEGLPGVGKTKGVIRIAERIAQDILGKKPKIVYLSGISESLAEDVAGIKHADNKGIALYYQTYLGEISKDYKDNPVMKNADGKSAVFPKNKKAVFNLHFLEEAIHQLDGKTDDVDLVILDECTHCTSLDLLLLDKFALSKKACVWACGDMDLSGVVCETKVDDASSWLYAVVQEYFFHGQKMGNSMRVGNEQVMYNTKTMFTFINEARKNPDSTTKYTLRHYTTNEGLRGHRVINSTNEAEIHGIIDAMVANLPANEKIAFVSRTPTTNSEAWAYILSKYPDKILDLRGKNPQGFEAAYYIVDWNTAYNRRTDAKELYTDLTRATVGCLVLTHEGSNLPIVEAITPDNRSVKEEPTDGAKLAFSASYLATIDANTKDALPIKLITPTEETTETQAEELKPEATITPELQQLLDEKLRMENEEALRKLLFDISLLDKDAALEAYKKVGLPEPIQEKFLPGETFYLLNDDQTNYDFYKVSKIIRNGAEVTGIEIVSYTGNHFSYTLEEFKALIDKKSSVSSSFPGVMFGSAKSPIQYPYTWAKEAESILASHNLEDVEDSITSEEVVQWAANKDYRLLPTTREYITSHLNSEWAKRQEEKLRLKMEEEEKRRKAAEKKKKKPEKPVLVEKDKKALIEEIKSDKPAQSEEVEMDLLIAVEQQASNLFMELLNDALILNTHTTGEIGCEVREDVAAGTKTLVIDKNSPRIDSANGLVKLTDKDLSYGEVWTHLSFIHSYLLNSDSKENALKKIKTYLLKNGFNLPDSDLKAFFFYKSRRIISKEQYQNEIGKLLNDAKQAEDQLSEFLKTHGLSADVKSSDVVDASIKKELIDLRQKLRKLRVTMAAFVQCTVTNEELLVGDVVNRDVTKNLICVRIGTEEDGDLIEIPLFTMPSAYTMLAYSSKDETVKNIYEAAIAKISSGARKDVRVLKLVVRDLQSVGGYDNLANYLEFYTHNGSYVLSLPAFDLYNKSTVTDRGSRILAKDIEGIVNNENNSQVLEYTLDKLVEMSGGSDNLFISKPLMNRHADSLLFDREGNIIVNNAGEEILLKQNRVFSFYTFDRELIEKVKTRSDRAEEILLNAYMEQSKDSANPLKVGIVKLLGDLLPLSDYITLQYKLQKGEISRDDLYLGTRNTPYYILKALMGDSAEAREFRDVFIRSFGDSADSQGIANDILNEIKEFLHLFEEIGDDPTAIFDALKANLPKVRYINFCTDGGAAKARDIARNLLLGLVYHSDSYIKLGEGATPFTLTPASKHGDVLLAMAKVYKTVRVAGRAGDIIGSKENIVLVKANTIKLGGEEVAVPWKVKGRIILKTMLVREINTVFERLLNPNNQKDSFKYGRYNGTSYSGDAALLLLLANNSVTSNNTTKEIRSTKESLTPRIKGLSSDLVDTLLEAVEIKPTNALGTNLSNIKKLLNDDPGGEYVGYYFKNGTTLHIVERPTDLPKGRITLSTNKQHLVEVDGQASEYVWQYDEKNDKFTITKIAPDVIERTNPKKAALKLAATVTKVFPNLVASANNGDLEGGLIALSLQLANAEFTINGRKVTVVDSTGNTIFEYNPTKNIPPEKIPKAIEELIKLSKGRADAKQIKENLKNFMSKLRNFTALLIVTYLEREERGVIGAVQNKSKDYVKRMLTTPELESFLPYFNMVYDILTQKYKPSDKPAKKPSKKAKTDEEKTKTDEGKNPAKLQKLIDTLTPELKDLLSTFGIDLNDAQLTTDEQAEDYLIEKFNALQGALETSGVSDLFVIIKSAGFNLELQLTLALIPLSVSTIMDLASTMLSLGEDAAKADVINLNAVLMVLRMLAASPSATVDTLMQAASNTLNSSKIKQASETVLSKILNFVQTLHERNAEEQPAFCVVKLGLS